MYFKENSTSKIVLLKPQNQAQNYLLFLMFAYVYNTKEFKVNTRKVLF